MIRRFSNLPSPNASLQEEVDMTRFLIYLFPAIYDTVIAAVFFVCAMRIDKGGMPASAVTAVLATWAVTYMLFAQLAGRVVTPRNAARLLVCSSVGVSLISVAFMCFPALQMIFPLMVAVGIAAAFFFTPFQVFMKAVEHGKSEGVVRPTALYTFSWSMGFAAGPFVAGMVWNPFGWKAVHWMNVVLGLVTAIGVLLLRHHASHASSTPEERDVSPQIEARLAAYEAMPDLAWLGWVGSGLGIFVISIIRGLFPVSGPRLGFSEFHVGMILAVLSVVQALVGLACIRSRTWMYRPLPILLAGVVGCVGAALFGVTKSLSAQYLAAACYGVYSGMFFFYLVFHSLVHPARSARYVSINESVVGVASILGPILGGVVCDVFSPRESYLLGVLVVVVALVVQTRVHRKHRDAVDTLRRRLAE